LVPERICAPLVDALLAPGPVGLLPVPADPPNSDAGAGAALLATVLHAGLFLSPLDELPEAADGPDAAGRWLAAAAASPADRDARALARVLVGLGCGLVRGGRYDDALRAGLALLEQGEALELPSCRLWGHVLLGAVDYERDRPAEAAPHFAAVLAVRDLAPLVLQREATYGLALALQALGRPAEAEAAVDQLAGALLATGNSRQLAAVDAFRLRLSLLRGDAAAGRHGRAYRPPPGGNPTARRARRRPPGWASGWRSRPAARAWAARRAAAAGRRCRIRPTRPRSGRPRGGRWHSPAP
jgi:hypothetical protein